MDEASDLSMTSGKQGDRFKTRSRHSGVNHTTAPDSASSRGVFGGTGGGVEADDARGIECSSSTADQWDL